MDFLARLKNLLRFAKITGPADNEKQFPVQQMTYKGKVVDCLQIFPYGVYANLSDDCLGVMFSIDGNPENRAAISYTPKLRPNDLEQNEIAFYHPYTGAFIKSRNNGDLEIDCQQDTPGNIIVNCVNAEVNATEDVDVNAGGDVNVEATGDANVTASNVNVDASQTNLGTGGPAIARVGDSIQVTIPGGSSAGTYNGTITSGGNNTSI